ncbi:MAG: hypothetical protein HZB56_09040 [Deltaproteobacteria bacterium]|nr:hypothetical protein [Deltaproteobacteria bacterium]
MKIWQAYGSEHSANLVMIGRFKTEDDAAKAKHIIEMISEGVQADVDAGRIKLGEPPERYTDEAQRQLRQVKVHSLAPGELEQFVYDISVELKGTEIVITTDEIDVSAFMKVLFDGGARIEVYSAHEYPRPGEVEPGDR